MQTVLGDEPAALRVASTTTSVESAERPPAGTANLATEVFNNQGRQGNAGPSVGICSDYDHGRLGCHRKGFRDGEGCASNTGAEYRLVHASQIDGAAHLIPFDPDSTTNCAWLVNSHIDIETWNEVTMDEDQMDEDSMDEDEALEETAGQSVMEELDSESDSSEASQW